MDDVDKEAAECARSHGLPVSIVLGIIDIESSGHTDAIRFECGYRWLMNVKSHKPFRYLAPDEVYSIRPPDDFEYYTGTTPDTEWIGQKTSWGPMQIMGAVARERGFNEPFFGSLCSLLGVHYGCLHLKWLQPHFQEEDWPGIISAYNQGSPRRGSDGCFINQSYVSKVMAAAQSWQGVSDYA